MCVCSREQLLMLPFFLFLFGLFNIISLRFFLWGCSAFLHLMFLRLFHKYIIFLTKVMPWRSWDCTSNLGMIGSYPCKHFNKYMESCLFVKNIQENVNTFMNINKWDSSYVFIYVVYACFSVFIKLFSLCFFVCLCACVPAFKWEYVCVADGHRAPLYFWTGAGG